MNPRLINVKTVNSKRTMELTIEFDGEYTLSIRNKTRRDTMSSSTHFYGNVHQTEDMSYLLDSLGSHVRGLLYSVNASSKAVDKAMDVAIRKTEGVETDDMWDRDIEVLVWEEAQETISVLKQSLGEGGYHVK